MTEIRAKIAVYDALMRFLVKDIEKNLGSEAAFPIFIAHGELLKLNRKLAKEEPLEVQEAEMQAGLEEHREYWERRRREAEEELFPSR